MLPEEVLEHQGPTAMLVLTVVLAMLVVVVLAMRWHLLIQWHSQDLVVVADPALADYKMAP
tara:strand:- start:299 stop:481 length:183 start_codon:yes stop_codon:yes gene_type:complete